MFCCEAKEVFSFLFFEVRMAAKRCSARVSPSHRLTSQTEKHQKQGTKNERTRHEKDWETKAPNGRRQRQQKRNKHQHTHRMDTSTKAPKEKQEKHEKKTEFCVFLFPKV